MRTCLLRNAEETEDHGTVYETRTKKMREQIAAMRSRLLFTPVTQAPLQGAGLLLGDDGVAVIRKNDHEEPVETRLFQAPLG